MSTPIQNSKVQDLIQTRVGTAGPKNAVVADRAEFDSILSSQLKVSGHANTRLQSRNIQLGEGEWSRVLDGVQRAAAKGSKESLVLIDDVALVVSVKNRTVITAVDKAHLKENVFTNIDSAVIV
jgi:flagellar operon protein